MEYVCGYFGHKNDSHLCGYNVRVTTFTRGDVKSKPTPLCSRCRGNCQRGAWGAGTFVLVNKGAESDEMCSSCGKNRKESQCTRTKRKAD